MACSEHRAAQAPTAGRCVIGVDLGGTKTAAGAVGADGRVRFIEEIPTLNRAGGEAVLDATATLVRRLADRLEADGGGPVSAVGVGAAGVVDAASGVVISSTDAISDWAGTNIATGLATRTSLTASVINDVHAHALGEAWQGAGRDAGSMLLASIGTGVGGSLINNGIPLSGARSVAGHIGHIASPDAAGLPCSCGRAGHVEAIASGPALHQHFLRLGGDASIRDARAVCALASEAGAAGQDSTGHRAAVDAVTTAARATGQALGGLANVLDPDVIVVGGGLAAAGPLWWDPLLKAGRAELMDPLCDIPIIGARLGPASAIIGAARHAFNSQHTSDGP
ncbi:ROK family protein [Arthrobacter castelli]|uniref:ROK family protein n=1 Tax=Arthrobacter castelli TaxID=271431 RepID=UPI0006864E0A|nr:ROK family protein [Arthrobacter castelli]